METALQPSTCNCFLTMAGEVMHAAQQLDRLSLVVLVVEMVTVFVCTDICAARCGLKMFF